MAVNDCLAAIHLCRIRVTRLDSLGQPVAGPNNVYVSDKPIMIGVSPVIEEGDDKTLVGGCDCIIASYRGYDKLKRFDLELSQGVIEPGLIEMLTGASVVLQGGEISGWWWPSQLSCSDPVQPNVALEGWQDLWEDDRQATQWPYLHWVWPSTRWQIGDHDLQNDFLQPTIAGFTRSNANWGDGIFGDYPEPAGEQGGAFYDDAIPAAQCGYITWSIT